MGISRSVTNTLSLHISKIGTPLYMPPEVLRKQPFDFKIDIWALGCVLYYLAMLEHPFNTKRHHSLSKIDKHN
jgi:NIMA (never in mitosis gene a)-related kinase